MNMQAWWIAFRPNTLIISIIPVLLGLALAYNDSLNNINKKLDFYKFKI